MKVLLVVFREKKFFLSNLIFLAFGPFFTAWLGMVKLSQATANWTFNSRDMIFFMITTGSLNMIRILKQGKMISQVNIYVVDIVWILSDVYVWRSKFMVL